MINYKDMTIREIKKLYEDGKTTPTKFIAEVLNEIKNSDLNAFITVCEKEALKRALELENTNEKGALYGIPVAVKDNIITKDIKTTAGSKMLEDFTPIYNANVVEMLLKEGAIIIGKTNMDEFAMGSTGETSYFGNTLNPVCKTKVPGGSSSGSAASVSGGLVPLSLGSDTGGSIRQPAGFTGIVGMKPTYGRVSRYGLIAFASSLDQIGPMTKTVYDNALSLEVIAGYDEKDSTSIKNNDLNFTHLIGKDIKGMKIAIPNFYIEDKINSEVTENTLKIANMLKENGATVEMIDIKYLEYAIPLYQIIALGEASSNLARFDGIRYGYSSDDFEDLESLYKNSRAEGFGSEVKRRIMVGSHVLSGDNADQYYLQAQKVRRLLKESFDEAFSKYDLIIGPVSTNVAYDFNVKSDDALKSFYDDLLTIPVNMAGLPAISIPTFKNSENLPIGLQIIGNYLEEDKIYQLASFVESKIKEGF